MRDSDIDALSADGAQGSSESYGKAIPSRADRIVLRDGKPAMAWTEGKTDSRAALAEQPRMAISGLAADAGRADYQAMKHTRLPQPRCGRIEPDSDNRGYYCTRCGHELIEKADGWYRHGPEFRHEPQP